MTKYFIFSIRMLREGNVYKDVPNSTAQNSKNVTLECIR